jgi:hypothetical protein
MHDMIGSAGMLRGWASVWGMQAMIWLFAAMSVTVGATAMAELVLNRLARRTQVTRQSRTSSTSCR